MRTNLFIGLTVLALGLAVGCASTSGNPDGGGTGGTGGSSGTGGAGGTGTGGSGGGSASDCVPACGTGSVCVGSGIEGGALITPNDAGVCPTGTHSSGGSNPICEHDLSYSCKPIPSGCNGTITCTCAAALCPSGGYACQVTSAKEMTCIEAVP